MTREELINKAGEFEDNHKHILWKPHDFPEDMQEDNTLDELWSEGDTLYSSLKDALELIHEMKIELEFK